MLTRRTLPIRNLAAHWRSHAPVLAGTAIGTAVLIGAFLVGSSLRGSLAAKAERQLNGIESAWLGTRFIRQELAAPGTPAMLLRGTVEANDRRVTNVTIVGLPGNQKQFPGVVIRDGAVVSHALAKQINLSNGMPLRISFEKPSKIPRRSLLGNRSVDDTTLSLRTVVDSLLPANDQANEFSLLPTPGLPHVVYVPLEKLQDRLSQKGLINAIFRGDRVDGPVDGVDLSSWGLTIRTERVPPTGRKVKSRDLPYLSLESDRFVIDAATTNAVQQFQKSHPGWRVEQTISYLAISIQAGVKEIPYSIVTGLNPTAAMPLGPFLPSGTSTLKDDEIALVAWPDSPLKNLSPGEKVTIRYFQPETETGHVEIESSFRFAGLVPFTGLAIDPSLTPQFPGITDKLSVRDWKPPFPYDSTKIKPNDVHEIFWQDYRTTPKAYMTLATAEKLFGSRYGSVTSLRFAPPEGVTIEQAQEFLGRELLKSLTPDEGGFVYERVGERLRNASRGGQDFGGLFLGFSLFLIVASLLLIGLLFRLATERRGREIGLLLAVGFSVSHIRRLMLIEGLIIAVAGAILGAMIAVPYARYLLSLLITLWPDDSIGSFLTLHVTPSSLIIGMVSGVASAVFAMAWAIRGLIRVSPPQLLRGRVQTTEISFKNVSLFAPSFAALLAVILIPLGAILKHPDAKAGCFFGSGACLLFAGLMLFRRWLRNESGTTMKSLLSFALRNAKAQPGRSLLTATLVAIATFLVIAVECFRRPAPSGVWFGATHLIETDVPIYQPFDQGPGFEDLLTNLEKVYSEQPAEESPSQRVQKARERLTGMRVTPLRYHPGDDASCLNLYQSGQPGVIGMPDVLWKQVLTSNSNRDDSSVPTVVESNSLQWMLKKSVGDVLTLPDGRGQATPFRFVGTLTDSPFQSELLIPDANFQRMYAHDDGYRKFLLTMPPSGDVSDLLEKAMPANGLTVTPIRDRVIGFQSVIGAYLTLFQMLGSLGLLLGVAGLVVVLVRGVWERSAEFALLLAVGYRMAVVQKIVILENLAVMVTGVAIGVVASIASILPHVISGGHIPVLRLAIILTFFLLMGLFATIAATKFALGRSIITGLRSE